MQGNVYIYIAVMSLVSLAVRVLPLTLIRGQIKNRFLRSFLYYVPYVTLAVMTFPAIVEANYLPPERGQEGYDEDAQAVWDAFGRYGVTDYVLLERGGVWYAVFGVMGVDSDACAPMSGMVFHDRFEAAKRVVDEARNKCREENGVQPLVVCLSHSGTDGQGKGEDYELAQKVRFQLRKCPELTFYLDDSLDYIENIDRLLQK